MRAGVALTGTCPESPALEGAELYKGPVFCHIDAIRRADMITWEGI
jgi:hypothetical protein